MSTVYNAPLTNPPTLIAAGASVVQDLGTLTANAVYLVTLQNASATDRAGALYQDIIDGWIKTGAAADVTEETGDPISVNVPVLLKPVAGKLRLSFIRSTDTPFCCKVFTVRVDA